MSNKTLFRILYVSLFVWVLAAGMGASAQAAVITNDGETIFYKGGVTKGDAAKVKAMIEDTLIQRISMSSKGGHAVEGFSLGYLFQKYNMTVIVDVDTHCLSACAVAVMGATTKEVKGLLGFHGAWSKGRGTLSEGMKQGQIIGTLDALYHFKMGYTLHLQYLIANWTDPDTFLILSQEDLELFEFVEANGFTKSAGVDDKWLAKRLAGPATLFLLMRGQ